jgi:hypothetical protein
MTDQMKNGRTNKKLKKERKGLRKKKLMKEPVTVAARSKA